MNEAGIAEMPASLCVERSKILFPDDQGFCRIAEFEAWQLRSMLYNRRMPEVDLHAAD
jgi:hypothetical protein